MSPSEFRWYVQDAIKNCDTAEAYEKSNFLSLIDQIRKVKSIGISFQNKSIIEIADRMPVYSSEDYQLDYFGKFIWLFLTRISWIPIISNKESSRQRRYIIEVKIFLHGIDEALRKAGC